ncbi:MULTISPECIES: gas vesicle accessory protein GvpU [Fictibacillus]|uniref:Gas vesicle accessory protein GvpU n=1 Tax=Fictibacillus terranigra TaxID=3058424 RepID=A0ABT8E4Z1_9BACL|nr:gas vesicle accessory protein GvpU [Fictibacillus sp. CENA-BCM004]MDN4072975.1 gas vesicle accessory protein GvpU [Fictibacillus sp. CENA-BCM004]
MSTDSILEFFVKASNKYGFSLDITLNVNGAVISGTTISAQEYLEALGEAFENGNEVSQAISERLIQSSEAIEEGNEDNLNDLHFIHLKNAQIYCGENKMASSKNKVLWRGSLDQVNGFFLGKITESKK